MTDARNWRSLRRQLVLTSLAVTAIGVVLLTGVLHLVLEDLGRADAERVLVTRSAAVVRAVQDASTGSLCPLPDQVELIVAGDRGRLVLHVAGEIDLATVAVLRHAIDQLLSRADGSAVIDLSGVTFMDCQGIAALFEAAGRAHAAGVGLSAVASPACERLIGLISIGDVVKHRLEEMEREQSALRDYIQTA